MNEAAGSTAFTAASAGVKGQRKWNFNTLDCVHFRVLAKKYLSAGSQECSVNETRGRFIFLPETGKKKDSASVRKRFLKDFWQPDEKQAAEADNWKHTHGRPAV